MKAIVAIFNWLSNINLIRVLEILIGTVVGACLAYFFSGRLDKKKVKRDIEIKASNELLEKVNYSKESLSKIYIQIFNTCNEVRLRSLQLEQYNSSKRMGIENNKSDLDILNLNSEYEKRVIEATRSIISIILYIENKKSIFHDFHKFICYIYDVYENFDYYEFREMLSKINYNMHQGEIVTKEMHNQLSDFCEKVMIHNVKIQSFLSDFDTEIQNTFLSKLFKYCIPDRKPTNSKCIVLSLDTDFDSLNEGLEKEKEENLTETEQETLD